MDEACKMFENTEEFRLIDVDGVLWSNPNYKVIPEPSGFGNIKITLSRNPDDRGGANFEFGQAERSLGFDKACQKQDILDIIEAKGVDANIIFQYYHIKSGVYTLQYQGQIVPSSMREVDYEVDLRVKRTDFGDKFRTRFEADQSYADDLDLDGNKIDPIEPLEIGLHSQALSFGYQAQQQVSGIATNYNVVQPWDFGDGDIPSVGFLLLDLQDVIYNDINTSLQIFTYPASYVGVDFFWQVYDGSDNYSFIYNIFEQSLYNIKCIDPGVYNIRLQYVGYVFVNWVNNWNILLIGRRVRIRPIARQYSALGVLKSEKIFGDIIIGDFSETWQEGSFFVLNLDEQVTMEAGDQIFFFAAISNESTSSFDNPSASATYEVYGNVGVLYIDTISTVDSTPCRGGMIYDVMNRLIKKSIGNNIEQFKINLSTDSGTFIQGENITSSSGGKGLVYSKTLNEIEVISVTGTFNTSDTVNTTSGGIGLIGYVDSGQVLDSTLIGRKVHGYADDGCASYNFITNGLSIRGFVNDEWKANLYYRKGDKVEYLGDNYEYINNTPTNNNLPTNPVFWQKATYRQISTSIEKILDFLRFRYGAGFAVVKQEGLGFGTLIDTKITKVLIEKKDVFFQDKLIMELPNVENPIVKKVNKEIIFNEIQSGYSIYGEPNESGSLGGFNTIRNDVTPIEKEKKELKQVADVCTDGSEIERLRRATINETENESDDKDEETIIIKCQLTSLSNVYDTGADGSGLSLEWFTAPNRVRINGLNTRQIEIGDVFHWLTPTNSAATITDISFNSLDNRMTLTLDQAHGLLGVNNLPFYVNDSGNDPKEVFFPERLEEITDVEGVDAPSTVYNLTHAPTNMLINNFDWFGSAYQSKDGGRELIFGQGKNNYLMKKAYRNTDCEPTTDQIQENQSFELSVLRSYNPELFTPYIYEVKSNMKYSDLVRLKDAMINESSEDINFGYVEFDDNQGNVVQGYPFKITYSPLTSQATLLLWGKA